MSFFQLRRWLPWISAAMFIGSAAVLVWSIAAPCRVETVEEASLASAAKIHAAGAGKSKPGIEDFSTLVAQRLQSPLFDPPPPKPPPVVQKEPPPPPVKLLATMPEPSGGCAMFAENSGATSIQSQGDRFTAGGVTMELIEIAGDHVVLRLDDRSVTLKLPK